MLRSPLFISIGKYPFPIVSANIVTLHALNNFARPLFQIFLIKTQKSTNFYQKTVFFEHFFSVQGHKITIFLNTSFKFDGASLELKRIRVPNVVALILNSI